MSYHPRDGRPEDARAIADIYNESLAVGDATLNESPKSAEQIESMIRGFGDREIILVLEDDAHSIVGWGMIQAYSSSLGYRAACETSVYLTRRLMGKGLGPIIKKALIDRCKRYGYHHLVAKVLSENKRSIEYNKKLGYREVGVQREIGIKNGRWVDVVILQLILEDAPLSRHLHG